MTTLRSLNRYDLFYFGTDDRKVIWQKIQPYDDGMHYAAIVSEMMKGEYIPVQFSELAVVIRDVPAEPARYTKIAMSVICLSSDANAVKADLEKHGIDWFESNDFPLACFNIGNAEPTREEIIVAKQIFFHE